MSTQADALAKIASADGNVTLSCDQMAANARCDNTTLQFQRSRMLLLVQFEGSYFAFLPKSNDIIELTPEFYQILDGWQKGLGVLQLRHVLRTASGGLHLARQMIGDLRRLFASGYLSPDTVLSDAQRRREFNRMLDHEPRNLMLFVTEACNLKCTYCYETPNGVHARARTLKESTVTEIVDRYVSASGQRKELTITFFGGEPLLNFRAVVRTVEYANDAAAAAGKRIGYCLTTNLTLLTDEIADFLVRHAFHVLVSMDGDRSTHDSQRPDHTGAPTYDLVAENLQRLLTKQRVAGVRPARIRATVMPGNDALAAERHLLELRPHNVMVGLATPSIEDRRRGVQVDATAQRSTRDAARSQFLGLTHAISNGELEHAARECSPSLRTALQELQDKLLETTVRSRTSPSLCGVCRNMTAVTPTGDYYPCHRYVGMESFRIGSLQSGIDRVRVQNYYRSVYDAYDRKCSGCWARTVCGGQCPWLESTAEGTIMSPHEAECVSIRFSYYELIGLYAWLITRYPEALRLLVGSGVDRVLSDKKLGALIHDTFIDHTLGARTAGTGATVDCSDDGR